jgi:1-pyrroline-5-carboxylate dehydrogenase
MGGKNALIVDTSADFDEAVLAVRHSAFGFQGQKCSAASRAYIPASLWPSTRTKLGDMLSGVRVGDVNDLSKGLYLISFTAGNQQFTKKLIIE